jgi:hypothetical protein
VVPLHQHRFIGVSEVMKGEFELIVLTGFDKCRQEVQVPWLGERGCRLENIGWTGKHIDLGCQRSANTSSSDLQRTGYTQICKLHIRRQPVRFFQTFKEELV